MLKITEFGEIEMTKTTTDRLSLKLRNIEAKVDAYYKLNPLVKLPFAKAAWHLLAFAEDMMLKHHFAVQGKNIMGGLVVSPEQLTKQERGVIADNFVNELNYPMLWLHNDCQKEGKVPFTYDDKCYKAAWNLQDLGKEYRAFVSAFTYASRGWIGLELKGSTIQPIDNLFIGIEYEAYNRLIHPHGHSTVEIGDYSIGAIQHSLEIQGDKFQYKLNPRIVSDVIQALKPELNRRFSLPEKWQFRHYSLRDFRRVFEVITAIAYIHFAARTMAASQGCIGMGYANSIYVPTHNKLLKRVVRHSGVSKTKVLSIFKDLSYGNRDISKPDPALQPLIQLNSKDYAIVPNLWLSSAAERNLTILLNRIPSEREIYSRLVSEKEALMQAKIQSSLSSTRFIFAHGTVSGLPDVDLALIDDLEKSCLLLELKWFIQPAEVREIIEKSEEIKKGICQLCQLRDAFTDGNRPLLNRLGIDSSYELEVAVASANHIGHSSIQNPEVAVIHVDHLIAKLQVSGSLKAVIDWLTNRSYLPTEGKHFEILRITPTVGNWRLKWYGLKPLISDAFFPL